MGTKRFVATAILPFICVAFLSSQSLVELAKKEKERRAKIKKKSTKVVTNADLKKGSKSSRGSANTDQIIESDETRPEAKVSPQKKIKNSQPKKDAVKHESVNIERLELKIKKTEEHVERLLQKMNDLWQKYNNPGDMTPKDRVQSEIAQTYLMLQRAQQEAAELKEQWDVAKSKEDT
ncbi:hypothetical protein ACFLT2_04485 [Acidobacteriota bacterium]